MFAFISVTACKDKWKNLRTVFMRRLKLGPSGGTTKKPYYLNSIMLFIIPFVKLNTSNSQGNVPSPPTSAEKLESDE